MKHPVFFKNLIVIILVCLFSACQNIPIEVDEVLKLSGQNRQELEKVINHYQKPEDSLKLKAAYFLIQNMSNKFSMIGGELAKLNIIFPAIEKARKRNLIVRDINTDKYLVVDSLWNDVSMKNNPLKQSYLTI